MKKASTVMLVILLVVIAAFLLVSSAKKPQGSQESLPAPQIQNQTATTTKSSTILPSVPDTTYKNTKLSFSITYPTIAVPSQTGFEGYLPLTQTPLTSFTLPKSMFDGTNLGEAGVYVGASSSPNAISSCGSPLKDSGETSLGKQTINGADFSVFASSDAGAGNFYDSKVYRRIENGWCVELVELLHSGNIGNYPAGTVKEFDKAKFSGILEAIVHTYRSIPTGV